MLIATIPFVMLVRLTPMRRETREPDPPERAMTELQTEPSQELRNAHHPVCRQER